MTESRVHKSLLNAKVNLVFYFITLLISFFSRKIFLECLGDDFVGLTGTIGNLLNFLNLAELGVGTAVGTILYKPLFDQDKFKINEIISVFGYIYRMIGFCILGVGILLSAFLPLIFPDTSFQYLLIYFIYYSFLASTLIGYFVNYKQTLLGADQRNYVVTAYFQTANLIKVILQMTLIYYIRSYYLWVGIELIFGVIYSIILNWKIKQVYPWLSADIKEGRRLNKKYPLIMTYSRQLFIHKVGSLVQFQIKPLLIYSFVSLKIVAYYGNYALIIEKLAALVNNVLGSTSAGVGSLIAEGDIGKMKKVFWELVSLRYYIAGIIVFSVYHLANPFITVWLGAEYVLGTDVLIIILCETFIMQTRGVVDQFNSGFGLFSDIWAPATEVVISLSVAFIGGHYWGLPGVLSGSVVSMFFIIVLWKPYLLYRKGFRTSLLPYWLTITKYLSILVVTWLVEYVFLLRWLTLSPSDGYLSWMMYTFVIIIPFALVSFVLMYFSAQGMRDFTSRIVHKLLKRT